MSNLLFLDTETTGLVLGSLPDTDFVEVALIDNDGNTIINRLCSNPGITIPTATSSVRGITNDMLTGAPRSDEIREQVIEAVRGKTLVIYNAGYDLQYFPGIENSAKSIECCMLKYADFAGVWCDKRQGNKWHKLTAAAEQTGYVWQGNAHRALADTLATRHVWNAIQ